MPRRTPSRTPHLSKREYAYLRKLLSRLDVPDCKCPKYLSCPCHQECTGAAATECRHCRGQCHCPPVRYQPPCRHVLAAGAALTIEEKAALFCGLARRYGRVILPDPPADPDSLEDYVAILLAYLWRLADPEQYSDPRKRPHAALADLRQDREAVLALRRQQGQSLWNAGDFWRAKPVQHGDVSAEAANGRNGAKLTEEHLRRPAAPQAPAYDLEQRFREIEDAARRRREEGGMGW